MRSSILLSTLVLLPLCSQDPQPSSSPVAAFAKFDGSWAGTFVGYDLTGKELYRIQVEQHYRTIDANTQEVRIRDSMANGKVITGRGENRAIRTANGELQLRCLVTKSTGETVEHLGRLIEGPDGSEQLVWYSQGEDRDESFREWVSGEGEDAVYHIHGIGRYGESMILMAGEYHRLAK